MAKIDLACKMCGATFTTHKTSIRSLCNVCTEEHSRKVIAREMAHNKSEPELERFFERALRRETAMPWERGR